MGFGVLPDELTALAKAVVDANILAGSTIATAESCTGGLVSAALTEISGSSAVFLAGFATYSNDAKINLLGVPAELIEKHGAVSEEVARAMAEGALDAALADIAISITGVAGPTGGSDEKPVGTVMFGRATRNAQGKTILESWHECFDAKATRAEIRLRAACYVLELLLP